MLGLHGQAFGPERLLVVDQVEAIGMDLEEFVRVEHGELARRERPVDRSLRGTVFEGARFAVLEPHEAGVEHADTEVRAGDDIVGVDVRGDAGQ